jgi:hypothetical protein
VNFQHRRFLPCSTAIDAVAGWKSYLAIVKCCKAFLPKSLRNLP